MSKMEDVQRGYDVWAAKPQNAKWVRKIDGTPIANDIVVCIAYALDEDKDALINELMLALSYVAAGAVVHERQWDYKPCVVASAALAKAKAAGFEP